MTDKHATDKKPAMKEIASQEHPQTAMTATNAPTTSAKIQAAASTPKYQTAEEDLENQAEEAQAEADNKPHTYARNATTQQPQNTTSAAE